MENKFILKFYTDSNGVLAQEIVPCEESYLDYKFLQKNVEGSIECVYYCDFGKNNLIAIVNEEGLLKHMSPTFYVIDGDKLFTPYPLVGNVLIVAETGEELQGLDESEIAIVLDNVYSDQSNYYIRASESYKRNAIETRDFLKSLGCVEITLLPDDEIEKEYTL